MPDNISHMRLSGVVPDANARAALDQVRSLRDRLQAVSVGGHVDANAMRRALQSLDDAEATVVQGGNGVATALAQVAAMAQTLEARSQAPSAAAILGAREQTQAVGNELFERRVLDPYLSFASEEDEAAYRAREEKRHRAIDVELAKHSSEGDFHAALLTREQLRDAGAHGATSSPDYNRLIVDEERAVDAAKAAVVRDHGNPDGIEASVRSQEEALRNSPNADDRAAAMGRDAAGVSATELAAITAAMQGAGIAVTPTNTSGHGVTVAAKQAGASTGRLVT